MDVARRLEALEEENARLREHLAMLEAAMGLLTTTPIEWGLTPSESRVFGCLLERENASKNAIMAALYRDDGRDEAEIKIVDVFICKLRKKIARYGLQIGTLWGQGYTMPPASKAAARALIEAAGLSEAA